MDPIVAGRSRRCADASLSVTDIEGCFEKYMGAMGCRDVSKLLACARDVVTWKTAPQETAACASASEIQLSELYYSNRPMGGWAEGGRGGRGPTAAETGWLAHGLDWTQADWIGQRQTGRKRTKKQKDRWHTHGDSDETEGGGTKQSNRQQILMRRAETSAMDSLIQSACYKASVLALVAPLFKILAMVAKNGSLPPKKTAKVPATSLSDVPSDGHW